MSIHLSLLLITSPPIVAECGFWFKRFYGGLRRDAAQQTAVGWLWRVRAADDRYAAVRERRGNMHRKSVHWRGLHENVYISVQFGHKNNEQNTHIEDTLDCSGDGSRDDSARITFPGLVEGVVAPAASKNVPGCQPRLDETCSLTLLEFQGRGQQSGDGQQTQTEQWRGSAVRGSGSGSGQAARWW
ncbi:hypothetical protein C8R43DRAFT_991081 [Mycena crocata]|nr:hypothetical protein C8R43DRAFT_991081 [Mycena crocata]